MSYTDKPPEYTKEEWIKKLESMHVQRSDMNKLIMNYLVTGESNNFCIVFLNKIKTTAIELGDISFLALFQNKKQRLYSVWYTKNVERTNG